MRLLRKARDKTRTQHVFYLLSCDCVVVVFDVLWCVYRVVYVMIVCVLSN